MTVDEFEKGSVWSLAEMRKLVKLFPEDKVSSILLMLFEAILLDGARIAALQGRIEALERRT